MQYPTDLYVSFLGRNGLVPLAWAEVSAESQRGKADAAVQEDTQLGRDQCVRCRNALAHAYLDLGQSANALDLWEQVSIPNPDECVAKSTDR